METEAQFAYRVSGWRKYLDIYYWRFWFMFLLAGRRVNIVEVGTLDIPDDSDLARLLRGPKEEGA